MSFVLFIDHLKKKNLMKFLKNNFIFYLRLLKRGGATDGLKANDKTYFNNLSIFEVLIARK